MTDSRSGKESEAESVPLVIPDGKKAIGMPRLIINRGVKLNRLLLPKDETNELQYG